MYSLCKVWFMNGYLHVYDDCHGVKADAHAIIKKTYCYA